MGHSNVARLIRALALAPLLACLVVGAATAVIQGPQLGAGALTDILAGTLGSAIFFACFALPTTFTIGLLTHHVFQRCRMLGWAPYVIAGAIVGAVFAAAMSTGELFFRGFLLFGAWGVPIGALTGLFGWLIRRPDRDQPASP